MRDAWFSAVWRTGLGGCSQWGAVVEGAVTAGEANNRLVVSACSLVSPRPPNNSAVLDITSLRELSMVA